ncbi:uncharacterized protein TNCV_516081 [Trichonephila clavipes]|nr:uncharacterized protein TNCV_516081 [Trichonephila clavipes]
MSRRKQRSAFDQVSEFNRGKIVACRDCGLSFTEIGSRVGRNQTTIMRICDCWMQEAEWSVRKTSIAWSTLYAEPQTSPSLMDNARPHVARIVQRLFVNHRIELLPWPARSPDLSLIENMWSMVAKRVTQITPPACHIRSTLATCGSCLV